MCQKGHIMYKNKTEDLENILNNVHPSNITKYIDDNASELLTKSRDFMEYMNEVIKSKKMTKQEILKLADIPLRYGYKILSQEKITRQRDTIIRICYAAKLNLPETQRALKIYGMNPLYARDLRDAVLISCFNKRPGDILDVNELLLGNGMDMLRPCGEEE